MAKNNTCVTDLKRKLEEIKTENDELRKLLNQTEKARQQAVHRLCCEQLERGTLARKLTDARARIEEEEKRVWEEIENCAETRLAKERIERELSHVKEELRRAKQERDMEQKRHEREREDRREIYGRLAASVRLPDKKSQPNRAQAVVKPTPRRHVAVSQELEESAPFDTDHPEVQHPPIVIEPLDDEEMEHLLDLMEMNNQSL